MKISPSKLISPRDVNFLLYDWLKIESLTASPRYSHLARDDFDSLLDLSLDLAQREFASHNRKSDENEPVFDGSGLTLIPEIKEALAKFYDSGLFASAMPTEVDGGQLPHTVYRACFAFFQAANIATAAYPMLSAANANLLLAHGSAEQINKYVLPIVAGKFFGTMCLSEPEAGSSLADVKTKAQIQKDGGYEITGNKMWISGGDHELSENIIHLVLARASDAPAGVRGLSLFIVPKYLVNDDGTQGDRNGVSLTGINHKLGYRGTVNTVLNFSQARGYLVGKENSGLEYMFHMMNEARIGVGTGAAAVGYSSYLQAADYASTRLQGRAPDQKSPESSPIAIIDHFDVRRMLLSSKSYVEGGLALSLYSAKLLDEKLISTDDEQTDRLNLLLDIMTPILKGWTSKWSLVANDFAIQVHGGYGYTRDYQVEQLWRDNRLNPIHEGTDGIQAIDLLGRKVRMRDGAAFTALVAEISKTIERAKNRSTDAANLASELEKYLGKLSTVTELINSQKLLSERISHAWLYADAFGHVVIAWIWLEQFLACEDLVDDFAQSKRITAHYFYTYELTSVGSWLDILEARGDLLLTLDSKIFLA
jgi:butyryl-CoA dehydrogenase